MTYKPGTEAPASGIYWCSVCKLPQRFNESDQLPPCPNMCGRGSWELVEKDSGEPKGR